MMSYLSSTWIWRKIHELLLRQEVPLSNETITPLQEIKVEKHSRMLVKKPVKKILLEKETQVNITRKRKQQAPAKEDLSENHEQCKEHFIDVLDEADNCYHILRNKPYTKKDRKKLKHIQKQLLFSTEPSSHTE